MHPEDVLRLLDDERPRFAGHGRVVERLSDVTRFRAVDGSHHVVVAVPGAFDERNADEVIRREVDHHRAIRAVPFEWTVYGHHAPADLLTRLERFGFVIGPREAVVVLDLNEPRTWIDEPADSIGEPRVVRVHDEQTLADFRGVAEAVFEKHFAFTTDELRGAIRAGSTEHRGYVAYAADGRPASIGRLYTHRQSRFGGLYGGGTLPAFRGRGFYRATVAARARDAVASGARFLRVDALPTSRPILERLGFQRLTDTWPCELRR